MAQRREKKRRAIYSWGHPPNLSNRSVEAKHALGIISLLQLLQAALSPSLASVPLLGALITERIVDIHRDSVTSSSLVQNVSDLVANLRSLLIRSSSVGLVAQQRAHKNVLVSVRESGALGANSLDAFSGVTIESDQRAVEDGVASDVVGKVVEGLLLRGWVVCLEVNGETGVHGSVLLAGAILSGHPDPFGKICVDTLLCVNCEGLQFLEGTSVCLVDYVNALLHEEDLDNRLFLLVSHLSKKRNRGQNLHQWDPNREC